MEMIMQLLQTGLNLWDDKEKNKYVDKLMKLKQDYYVEINKPQAERDDAILDNIEFELRNLSIAFSTTVGKQNA